jgi:hypothetical protein
MTTPVNFPTARGKLVGSQGPIPEASGIVARLSVNDADLVVTPWPLPPTGTADLAVEIAPVDGTGVAWSEVESIEVEQVPGAGAEGTVGYVKLRDAAQLTESAVPLVPDQPSLQRSDIQKSLVDSNNNVRLMLEATVPAFVESTPSPTAMMATSTPDPPQAPSFRRVSLSAPQLVSYSSASGGGICRLLRID